MTFRWSLPFFAVFCQNLLFFSDLFMKIFVFSCKICCLSNLLKKKIFFSRLFLTKFVSFMQSLDDLTEFFFLIFWQNLPLFILWSNCKISASLWDFLLKFILFFKDLLLFCNFWIKFVVFSWFFVEICLFFDMFTKFAGFIFKIFCRNLSFFSICL